ncbi:MAG: hypothetical protein R6V05_13720, partial [Candidatus Brocadiia bacterium]
MVEGRKKVLEMLSEGKVSAEEAERLLDRLSALKETAPAERGTGELAGRLDEGAPEQKKPPRFLRVVVNSNNGDKV